MPPRQRILCPHTHTLHLIHPLHRSPSPVHPCFINILFESIPDSPNQGQCVICYKWQQPYLIYNHSMAAAYKPYVDYITAGNVAETAYILSHEGAVCGTSLPITEMPRYELEVEDETGNKKKVVVDERVSLLEALNNNGVSKQTYGIRLYNQKYYPVRYDADKKSLYLKKNKGGACVVKTNQFILIGTFNEELTDTNSKNQNPGDLNARVETLAKDLTGKGF